MLFGLICLALLTALFLYERRRRKTSSLTWPIPWWYVLFFFSGFPALLYQIVWQRALFTIYGVNIESVTMVVTAFMLGLGLGSLLGGIISKKHKLPLLVIFGGAELAIGAFGIISLHLFHWAALFTAGVPPLETGLIAFTLVVIPTMLMGATLPILVSYTVRISGNVGTSVAALYAVNTLGSATACFCAGLFIMRSLGESGSVAAAAAMNALVGVLVLAWHFRTQEKGAESATPAAAAVAAGMAAPMAAETVATPNSSPGHGERFGHGPHMNFALALIVVAIAGFISLAYEIVWYRLFSFTTASLAKSFAYLLGAYLAGIGFGSLASERICRKATDPRTFFRFVAAFVLLANLLGFMVAPILFSIVRYVPYTWTLLPIGLAAGCLGAVFPLICHLSVAADARAGARMSYLYLSNIIGSALGSYIVGFVLMDVFATRKIAVALALAGVALGVAMLFPARLPRRQLVPALIAAAAVLAFIPLRADDLFDAPYEKLLLKVSYVPGAEFAHVVETKSGVIAVTPLGIVFGGGIYDGRFSVDLVHDSNGIQRAFAVSYFHPNPKEVLMIGLSSGSWAQVIANHPQVQHLTIVEINPGYLRLIPRYRMVASLLHNPKVEIVIDDGRRWLARNPERKFDLIVMNTSYHWRSHASNVLSTDFLQLIRRHLYPGGVDFYNTTGSPEVQATGVKVFPYGLRVANFIALSDSPFQLDRQRWREILAHYTIDGKPVFDLSRKDHRARLEEVLAMAETLDRSVEGAYTLESAPKIRERTLQARIITDDNMGTEWLQ